MSIGKRMGLYLLIAIVISLIVSIPMMLWTIEVSPAIIQAVDSKTDDVYSQFIQMGYEESGRDLIRKDPYKNFSSYVTIEFANDGSHMNTKCETAYINTRSAADIYSDIEKSISIMGQPLDSQKEKIMEAIQDIRDDKSVHTSGGLENGRWSISSSTYNDKEHGNMRYVCFAGKIKYS